MRLRRRTARSRHPAGRAILRRSARPQRPAAPPTDGEAPLGTARSRHPAGRSPGDEAPRRTARPQPPVAPTRFTLRDVLDESLAGVLQRPGRSLLTALGTVLGVGTFVAVLGLTATASSQIDSRFSVLSATEVTVTGVPQEAQDAQDPQASPGAAGFPFPADADRRVGRLHGVRGAGVYWPVALGAGVTVRSAPVGDSAAADRISVVAASPGLFAAVRPTLVQGRLYDAFADGHAQPVAVIGTGTAAELGISTLASHPAVFVGDQAFTVAGIISDVEREPDLLSAVIVPRRTAEQRWGTPKSADDAKMVISTEIGAAQQLAAEAPTALRPDHPRSLKATAPPDPRTLRGRVTSDLNQLFLLLAGICLVIGAVGIANTTLVAVLERTPEIGLRRALGARGRHITRQFLAESGVLGAMGGLVGTALGTATVVLVALARQWTPVMHASTVAVAPLAGLLTGLAAGIYPAWRASRIEPAEALRR